MRSARARCCGSATTSCRASSPPSTSRPREPDAAERRLAAAAFGSIAGASPLYARIDMIRDARGEPVVLELELTEPSLYFVHAPDAANRFADALLES